MAIFNSYVKLPEGINLECPILSIIFPISCMQLSILSVIMNYDNFTLDLMCDKLDVLPGCKTSKSASPQALN